jgi:HEPN domain-containing protein
LSSFHVSRILLINKERFPKWFPIVEFAEISRKLAEKREPAMYGSELKMVPASVLFSKEEASEALKNAEKIYSLCLKLLKNLKDNV